MAESITIPKWFIGIVAMLVPLIASLWGGGLWVYDRVDTKIKTNEESIEAIEVNQAVQDVKLDYIVQGVSALTVEHTEAPPMPPAPVVYEAAREEVMLKQEAR